jgi:dTDP-4-amino-4,6-dideoxygalactose transaminase
MSAYEPSPRNWVQYTAAVALAQRLASVPMHPYLDELTQDRVITAVREACAS